jgi:uncharacterized protein involved in response to NO
MAVTNQFGVDLVFIKVILVICWGRVVENRRVYRTRVKRERTERIQSAVEKEQVTTRVKMVGRVRETARTTHWACAATSALAGVFMTLRYTADMRKHG